MTDERSPDDSDSNFLAFGYRRVQTIRARLCSNTPTCEISFPGLLLISGVTGILFTCFSALSTVYWEQRASFYLPREYLIEEIIILVLTLFLGFILFSISCKFTNRGGQVAALAGSILMSTLIIYIVTNTQLAGEQISFSRIVLRFDFIYKPILTISLVAYLSRPKSEEATTGQERHLSWLHRLFPSDRIYELLDVYYLGRYYIIIVAILSAFVFSLFIYCLLLFIRPGIAKDYINFTGYLGDLTYFGSIFIVSELVILGYWVTNYKTVWEGVESCFAIDESEDEFEEVLEEQLKRMYDPLPIVIIFNLLWFHLFGTKYFSNNIPEFSFTAIIIFLGVTILYYFYRHIRTVGKFLEYRFDSIYTAARRIEKITKFTFTTTVLWFGTISGFIIISYVMNSMRLESLIPVYLTVLGPLIMVGFLLVIIPVWKIHVKLRGEKEKKLEDIHADYTTAINDLETDNPSHEVTLRVNATRTAYEATSRIKTWPHNVGGLVKVFIPSLVPIGRFLVFIMGNPF